MGIGEANASANFTITASSANPSTGKRKVGHSVTVTLTASESGLSEGASGSTINGKDVSESFTASGIQYSFKYTVAEGDADREDNALPISLSLQDAAGNEVNHTTLTSSPSIDANTPSVTNATVSPDATNLAVGDNVTVYLTAADAETGLLQGAQTDQKVNGEQGISFAEVGGGVYSFTCVRAIGPASTRPRGPTRPDAVGPAASPAARR